MQYPFDARRPFFSKRAWIFVFFLTVLSFSLSSILFAGAPKPFDHSTWDQFLKKFVNEKGEVDYAGVKKDPSLLEAYLKQMSPRILPKKSENENVWPREERMAILINAYHAGMIDQIRRHYPIKVVGDIPNFWEAQCVAIEKDRFSLNSIRNSQLLQTFRDVKIHTVLSWAARGGPRLRQEAFTGPLVEGQLFMATREFVNNPEFVRVIPGRKKIEISKIFEWNAQDFLFNFSSLENDQGWSKLDFSVLSFLANYLEDPEKVKFLEENKYKIKYLPFDWSLNEWVKNQEHP